MRRSERERMARKAAYQLSRGGYWRPNGLSIEDYQEAVKDHPPMSEMLDYLSENHRDWEEDESDLFRPSEHGICEKCSTRALNLPAIAELNPPATAF
jgi:hypothetical protein